MRNTDYSSLSPDHLVKACVSGESTEAWREFVRRFHRLIATIVLRTARRWGVMTPEVIDDVVQETYLKLCDNNCQMLREFAPRFSGSFCAYLKVVTANTAHDYFKARNATKRGAGRPSEDLAAAESAGGREEAGSQKRIERDLLLGKVDEFLRFRISGPSAERDRTVFWLYYQQGMTAQAIASLPYIALTTKGVESLIWRLTRLVQSELVAVSGPGIRNEKGLGGENRSNGRSSSLARPPNGVLGR